MAQNQEGKQSLKAQRRYHAHIDRGNGLSVISKKCLPALRRRLTASGHIFRDGRLGDLIAKLQELAMDPRCTRATLTMTTIWRIGSRSAQSRRSSSPR